MHWESSGVVGFDLGPLLQGQMRIAKLKSAYNSLIIGPGGFGALSLRWIQFARSSFNYYIHPAGHGHYFAFPSESPFIAAHLQVQVFYVSQLNLVWRFNFMRVCVWLLSWQYMATSVAVATLFHVSWALISFWGFFAFQTPAWIGAD